MNRVRLVEQNSGPVSWVFIHGWGSDSNLWEGLRRALRQTFLGPHYAVDLPGFGAARFDTAVELNEYLYQIAEALPDNCVLVGWSLGGMIATQAASLASSKIKALITLACNPCFTQTTDWPCAMSMETFDQFENNFSSFPQKTWQRFCALQALGCDDPKALIKILKQQSPPSNDDSENWQQGLIWLRDIDNRDTLKKLTIPSLHLLGEDDGLVPASAALDIAGLGFANVQIIHSAGHCLHLTQTVATAEAICCWLNTKDCFRLGAPIDKRKIAQSFGAAAKTYDSAAQLQKQVAEELYAISTQYMLSLSAPIESDSIENILDLGCGTGYISNLLMQDFSSDEKKCITLLDIAEPMLRVSKNKFLSKSSNLKLNYVCADAESLPFRSGNFEWVLSSLALQWCDNLSVVSREVARIIAAEGHFVFSTLGPDTLVELRNAWASVNGFVHVNRFKTLDEIKAEVAVTGFEIVTIRSSKKTVYYPELRPILQGLKAIGAHNMNTGQNPGLTSVKQFKKLESEYEKMRAENGLLPVSYDVVYLILKKGR